jgi:hypothetical protein
MQRENAKTPSTLETLLKLFVDTMQCSIVKSLMLTPHSLDVLILTEMQLPRNARVTQLLQPMLEKVFVVMEETTRESSVVTIWSALITFAVQK